jgi:hypothetical protein
MIKLSDTDITITTFYEPKPIWGTNQALQPIDTSNESDADLVTIIYQVTIPSVQFIGYETADEAYAGTKNLLLNSVLYGKFTNYTQSDAHVHGVVPLYHVKAVQMPTVSSYSVLMPDLPIAIALFIMIFFFFLIPCACCCFVFCCIPFALMMIFCPSQANWIFGYRTGPAAYEPLPTNNNIEMVNMNTPTYSQPPSALPSTMAIPVTTQYVSTSPLHTTSMVPMHHGPAAMTVSSQGNYTSARSAVMYTAIPTYPPPPAAAATGNVITVTGTVVK